MSPFGRSRLSLEKILRHNFKKIGYDDAVCIHVAQDTVCENGNELPGSTRSGEFLDQLSNYWLLKDSLQRFLVTVALILYVATQGRS
jgi:hypothetical protein